MESCFGLGLKRVLQDSQLFFFFLFCLILEYIFNGRFCERLKLRQSYEMLILLLLHDTEFELFSTSFCLFLLFVYLCMFSRSRNVSENLYTRVHLVLEALFHRDRIMQCNGKIQEKDDLQNLLFFLSFGF